MIYLDNSATSNFKPLSVRMASFILTNKNNSANPSRSGHTLSLNLAKQIMQTRINFHKTFNNDSPLNVIFTSGCTESLNTAILGTAKENGHIITSIYEHNSVLRSLEHLKETKNIEVTYLKEINLKSLVNAKRKNTYMLIINHISNVTGEEQDIKLCGDFAKKNNLIFLVDGAQSVGHKTINMKEMNINLLAIAGHKGIHALSGSGVLLLNNIKDVSPLKFGGTGTNSEELKMPTSYPEKLEAGTINTVGIICLNKGLSFTNSHLKKLQYKYTSLSQFLLNELEKIKEIKTYTPKTALNGVIAFNIKNTDSQLVSNYLNTKFHICVRSGLHCAPLIHKNLNTLETGAVRVSLGYKTTKKHIITLIKALKSYIKESKL